MNYSKLLTGILPIFAGSMLALSAQQAEDEGEVYELSPFTVDETENVGYQATNTLAGSRLRTSLRDVGSSISILTEELFEDTGATDASTVLSYALNVEVGGFQGNFANAAFGQGRPDENANRINPQGNQRIRGLDSATITRNFFLTDIPFDSYNTSRVTINRGPNSILFGVGSPGGIINNTLNNASVGADFGEIVVRIGGHNSYRTSFDYNKVLVEDRVAIRVSALNESQQFKQRPAYEDDERFYVATEIVLLDNKNSDFFGKMILRANIESGEITSNPVKVIPPQDDFSNWWNPPSADFERYTGGGPTPEHVPPVFQSQYTNNIIEDGYTMEEDPTSLNVPYFEAFALIYPDASGNSPPDAGTFQQFPSANGFQGRHHEGPGVLAYDIKVTRHPHGQSYATGFFVPSIQDRNIFDYHNLLFSGNTSRVAQDFDTFNVALVQTFFEDDRAGFEVVFDRQDYERESRILYGDFLGRSSPSGPGIDIQELLANGEPNPNLGRPMVTQNGSNFNTYDAELEAARFTAFYDLNFEDMFMDSWGRWLGRHTITGFLATQEFTQTSRNFANTWFSDEVNAQDAIGGRRAGQRPPIQVVYVGPSYLNASSPAEVRLEQVNIPAPQDGDVYNIWYRGFPNFAGFGPLRANNFRVGTHLNGGSTNKREIDSEALVIQNRFLNGHLVTLFGWRSDESTNTDNIDTAEFEALTGYDDPRDDSGIYREEFIRLSDSSLDPAKGNTFSQSVVLHIPEDWTAFLPGNVRLSGHFSESENFSPSGIRRTVYGDVLPPPTGVTEEIGFTIDVNRRFSARFNWFTTSSEKKSTDVIGLRSADVRQTIERIAFSLSRTVERPINEGFTFEDTKAFWLRGDSKSSSRPAPGVDPIPNINSFEDMFEAILNILPPEVRAFHNFRLVDKGSTVRIERDPRNSPIATSDLVTEGFEIDLVANPTDNWRLQLNVGKAEAISSNGAPEHKRLVDYMNAQWADSGFFGLRDSVTFGAGAGFERRWNARVNTPLNAFLTKEGTTVPELRKWRANLITNYQFSDDTVLKGWSVGGAARWLDEITIGFPTFVNAQGAITPDLSSPINAPDQLNGDLWIGHRRKLTDKIDWRIQLNVRNAFGDNDDIPVAADPDGKIAVFRIPNEHLWFITNTFSF
jgi:outer membrane receptor protein involved in Fe transport